MISILTLGTKSMVYSTPRWTSVWPRWRPKPRTSVISCVQTDALERVLHLVEPVGLMMASFMPSASVRGADMTGATVDLPGNAAADEVVGGLGVLREVQA